MNEYADIVTRLRKWESSSVREHEDALREAASAIESLRAENDGVSSLLAVLHGDGGHYESEHGRQKAIEDAAKVYYRLYERCGVLEAEVDAWRDCPHDHFAKVWDQPQMSGRHRSEPRQRIIDAMYATDAERSKP